jgi:hypothetical protein
MWYGDAMPLSGLVVDEEDFIPAVLQLKDNDEIVLKLVGAERRRADNDRCVVFRRQPNQPTMLVSIYKSPDISKEGSSACLEFDKFLEGLSYLFPKGELLRSARAV